MSSVDVRTVYNKFLTVVHYLNFCCHAKNDSTLGSASNLGLASASSVLFWTSKQLLQSLIEIRKPMVLIFISDHRCFILNRTLFILFVYTLYLFCFSVSRSHTYHPQDTTHYIHIYLMQGKKILSVFPSSLHVTTSALMVCATVLTLY